jgi:ComF family protein
MLAAPISELSVDSGRVLVIPVPLHRVKGRERGFNQAELIARAALKQINRPEKFELAPKVFRRGKATQSQIGLTRHQRRENLRGAFSVVRPEVIVGRDVLLIDDVFTTGTTASECARVLRRAGASKVWVATVARTLKREAQGASLEGPSRFVQKEAKEPLAVAG